MDPIRTHVLPMVCSLTSQNSRGKVLCKSDNLSVTRPQVFTQRNGHPDSMYCQPTTGGRLSQTSQQQTRPLASRWRRSRGEIPAPRTFLELVLEKFSRSKNAQKHAIHDLEAFPKAFGKVIMKPASSSTLNNFSRTTIVVLKKTEPL